LEPTRLSSAVANYQKTLQQLPGNKRASKGLDNVFNQYLYLKLAVEQAKDNDFDDVEEYLLAAKKLTTVSHKIKQLKN